MWTRHKEFASGTFGVDHRSTVRDGGRRTCTKLSPMPKGAGGYWNHPEARETDVDSENYIEYRCAVCGIVFTTEMPD